MAEARAAISIVRHVCIHGGGCDDKPWLITDIMTVDGVEFINIGAKIYGFKKFVFGSTSRGSTWDVLKDMQAMRLQACVDALVPRNLFENRSVKKRQRKEALNQREQMPGFVTIELPPIDDEPAMPIKVMSSLDLHKSLAVELSVPALTRVRDLLLSEQAEQTAQAAFKSTTLRWRSDRLAWVACKMEPDGTTKQQAFPCKEPGSPAKRVVRDLAVRWLNECD